MSDLRGKGDWLNFFVNFEARSHKDMSLADYCRIQSVSYKTARNWASKLRSEGVYPEAGKPAKGKQGQGQKKQGQGQAGRQGQGQKGNRAGTGGDSGIGGQKTPQTTDSKGKTHGDAPKPARKFNPASLVGLRPPFEKGNRAAVKHGAYSRYLPPEIAEAVEGAEGRDLRSVIDEIKLTKGRLLMLQQLRAEWDAKAEYQELTHDDYVLTDIETGPEGEKTKRKRPDFELQEDRLTRTLAWLVQVQEQLQRQTGLSADDKIAWRRQIIDDGEAAGWTYARIGLEIERHGLEVPMTLMALIRQELEQPAVDTTATGFTDEELEALSEQYAQDTAGDDEWLQQRKAEVGTIHAGQDAAKVAQ